MQQNWESGVSVLRRPFILESSSVVGTKEADGPLGGLFDIVGKDDRFGQNTWEKAESSMQRDALTMALEKHIWMHPTWTMYLQEICSDSLWPQHLVWKTSAFRGLSVWSMPTCGESLSLAAAFVAAGYARHAVAVTSSHFGSAEKQFRFP